MVKLSIAKSYAKNKNLIILAKKDSDFSAFNFSEKELKFIEKSIADKKKQIVINQYDKFVFVIICKEEKIDYKSKELLRKSAFVLQTTLQKEKIKEVDIFNIENKNDFTLSFAEGLILSNYQFLKYFNKKEVEKKLFTLENINLVSETLTEKEVFELQTITEAVYLTRDLVNEPVSYLNAPKLVEEIKKLGLELNFNVEIFEKSKIESLKMGGLLAVNQGSIDPPYFSILEWKPKNAKNTKPIVLLGKGVVYDTGGLSLKPSNHMTTMKADMGGAGSVIGTFYAVAKNNLPIHLIGLIPATDNRPCGNAYTPDDVVTMYDGTTVEVKNTDAEGRMILADALSYAKKYEPKLVIDLATLTGATAYFIGKEGIASFPNEEGEEFLQVLKKHGKNVYERLVEFPMWEEYSEYLKSDIADMSNVSSKAGAITAGKFLEHFTDYPWIHLDIAGTAFLEGKDNYRGKGATASGVRLLYDYLRKV